MSQDLTPARTPLTMGRSCEPDITLDAGRDNVTLILEDDEHKTTRLISRDEARMMLDWLTAFLPAQPRQEPAATYAANRLTPG